MAKKCKNIIIKQGLDDWVMTYGDMMSLLLTFFVLIVSFSSMQESKFNEAAASLQEAFGVMSHPESVIAFNTPIVPSHSPQTDAEDLYEVRSVEEFLLDENLQDKVEVEVTEDGVRFRIDAPFMFESGGAQLKDQPRKTLEKLAGFFKKYPYEVEIQGHTDNLPINSDKYPSNWELSGARAVAVARYFQGLGVAPERIEATGFGEYRPIADNSIPEGREKNRRVEIFLKMKKKDLPRGAQLPFEKVSAEEKPAAPPKDENVPVRPIINPVTGKLGLMTGNKQP